MEIIKKNIIFLKGSKKYFFATLFIPPKYRSDIVSLYNFSRLVDDSVDNDNWEIEKLDEFISKFKKCFGSNRSFGDPIVDDFINTAVAKNIPYSWIDALFESIRSDTLNPQLEKLEETLKYTYGVAEVIGLMVCKICNLNEDSYDYARYAGRAAQWANFLRDIYEDNQKGRGYLPKEEFSVNFEQPVADDEYRKLLKKQIDRYSEYRELSMPGYDYLPWWLEWSLRLSAFIDDLVVTAISEDPEISLNQEFRYKKAFLINIKKGLPL